MLETPLFGRYQGENKRLVFTAPAPYHALIRLTALTGAGMIVAPMLPVELPFYPQWWLMIGTLLIGAAVLAAFSLQTIVFNLRERVYHRRHGPGFFPTFTRGKIDAIDALVVVAEACPGSFPPVVTFHMVLHWKGNAEPIMVVQRESRPLGQPLNAQAGPFLQLGARYAQSLGIKFFDNSYYPSPCPVPIWR
ncbi:hypothetical protein [Fimbriimonas ginsengisoli]|uniref:Uncharacterized protein n=1 Tax=Fimbriimonas ginsengisoli Gsoil 348 TaxID=661478 RepID=A0A068NVI2_FIMGI|nr:hypothetical protein [Fimbriimonas ginsengisoli]AIE86800.1 hypothetical protein OP10G_3432 [Fimbriimonas ginsengisoli Gsoil 348]